MKKRILCKAAAAVFYLMLPWMALTCQAGEDVISEGVFINGVDVSGMTAAEAETVVQQQVQALSDSVITLTMEKYRSYYRDQPSGNHRKYCTAI